MVIAITTTSVMVTWSVEKTIVQENTENIGIEMMTAATTLVSN